MNRRDDKFPDNGFEAWGGYMQAKIAKLEEQFSLAVGNEVNKLSNIFNAVSIYVNGYTIPSADELKELMSLHGGVYHTYLRSDDFIIASNLPDTKVKNMSLARVVRPEWITNSIASKCLLDYRDYLLYGHSKTQPRLDLNFLHKNKNIKTENESLNIVLKKEIITKNNFETTEIKKNTSELGVPNFIAKDILRKSSDNLGKVACKKQETTKTAADPNFISEFYSNSRLHHISQLGACFKQYINDLRENSTFEFPARYELKTKILSIYLNETDIEKVLFQNNKTIMHIDMDCFFVSVGLRTRPHLRGKPVAVTHSRGGQTQLKRSGVDRETEFNMYRQKQEKKIKAVANSEFKIDFKSRVDDIPDEDDKYGSMSEIASCSYEARAKGISNGMFMGTALKLCPDLLTIPYDFEGYKEVAYALYNIIAQYTLDIEAVSCDEMYVDCTELLNSMNVCVEAFATTLRDEIIKSTGCPCSTGFGGNRLQARLATKKAKPNGQFFLTKDLVDDFMYNIKLKDLPGVGRQTTYKLESLGHQTCGSLQSLPLTIIQRHLGNKTGVQLFEQCRGQDSHCLSFHTIRKSVSAEVNYGIRFENNRQCEEFIKQLSVEVQSRMQQFKVLGKSITLKLMIRAKSAPVETAKFMGHGFCDIINKSTNLPKVTNDAQIIAKEVITICKKLNIDPKEMRGIGIQITKLKPINNKQAKSDLSKFFATNSTDKTENAKSCILKSQNTYENNFLHQIVENQELKPPTTPKKQKNNDLSLKKSPIIGQLKPQSERKRGRPTKRTKQQNALPNNLMIKFLHGSAPREAVKTEFSNEIIVKDEPIIKEQKPQGLLGLPWKKVRELVRAWFDSGQVPKSCDVDLIAVYMREMVVQKNIGKLNILVNFMRRRIFEMDSTVWCDVEHCVMEQVQNAMIAIYGKKLYVMDL